MKKLPKKIILSGVVFLLSYQAVAASFYNEEDALRLRLRNDFRRAERPSAGSDKNIYAWVQGAALEYNSSYYQDIIGVDIGGFYVYKLGARDNWSTRWYLDGHDSFGRYTAALKLKLSNNLSIKAGRMVTDSLYSGQEDLPIINASSQRTVPTLSDAVLMKYSIDKNYDIYAMYRYGVYYYSDVAEGVHRTGPIDPKSYRHNLFRPQYITSLVFHDSCNYYAASSLWQEDVALQLMGKTTTCYPLAPDRKDKLKAEFTAFYANLDGMTAELDGPKDTSLLSGQLSYIHPVGSLFFGVGKTGGKLNRIAGIDTDLGYPFDLSIDRNHSDMWSYQLGATLNMPGNSFIGIAETLTNGYETYHHDVRIRGAGTNFLFGWQAAQGKLQGLKIFVALNRAREHRNGSALGDRLDYYDSKVNIQYDFTMK